MEKNTMNNAENIKAFDDWNALLSSKWGIEINIMETQQKELSSLLYTIGVGEMNECIDIVGAANEPARSVRYLLGVIKNRQRETPTKRTKPAKATTSAGVYVYQRCDKCMFVNKVRRDVLAQQHGKAMRCGGVDCKMQWRVDDILMLNERETNNA